MQRRPVLLVSVLFLVIAAGIASCGGGSSSTGPGVPGGGSSGPSFDLAFPATSSSRTFAFAAGDTGTWQYACSPHGNCCGMKGVVVVSSSATAESALVSVGPGDQLRYSPDTVRIKPGRSVRWVNVSSFSNHTVTR